MPITLEEIKQIIDDHTSKDDRTLRLPPGAIPSLQIDALYQDYLLDADLVVLQAQSVLIPNVNVTVVGNGSSFPFSTTTITAVFTVRDGEAALVLTATGVFAQADKWDFTKAFPSLASTFYKRLTFNTAELILRSYDVSAKQPKGLHFTGQMELTGKLIWLLVFLNGANPVSLSGAITLRTADLIEPANAIPLMALRPTQPSEVFIGTFDLSIIYELADMAFVTDKGMIVPVPEMQLVSAISVDTATDEEAFKISTHFTDDVGMLTFQANDIGAGVEVGMQALSALANGTNLQRVLPSQLPVINYFAFKNWSLTVDPRNMSLKTVNLGVETTRPWEVIPGLLTLENLKFQFVISDLLGKFETSAELNAGLGIGEGEAKFIISLDAFYPSYIIAGSLESETPIDLKIITRKFLGEAIADTLPDTLQVTVLGLMLDPKSRAFTFQTVITTDWTVSLGIATFGLTSLSLDINYLAGASQGGITASVLIGPEDKGFMMDVSASFDSEDNGWLFSAELSSETPITLKDLIDTYLPEEFRIFEPPDVTIKALALSFDTGEAATYTFNITVEWRLDFGEGIEFLIGAQANIESYLKEVPEAALKRVYKGFIRGTLDYSGIRLEVELQFDHENTAYIVRFEGIEGILKTIIVDGKEQRELEVKLPKGKTLGGLITTLINAVMPGSDITLSAPWNVLNSLSLDSFAFKVNFTTRKVGFTYEPNLNLGFASIDKLELEYDTQNSTVMFRILKGRFLDKQIPEQQQVGWNVLNPGETQQVPGQGTRLFDLQFLGVGQHVAIKGLPPPDSVLAAVNQMEGAFHEAPGLPASSLALDENINWLIGTRFTVVEAFNIGIVFNDPEMYGLVLSVDGAKAAEKAKIFKGLRFEILYKKVSETVGVYQIDFQLPDVIRQLEFGAVSVTLPNLKLHIYTNGDFKVDLGFPENEDFARSFSVQAWPFLGSGGLYFGKLSGETAPNLPQLPQPPRGNFSPVIVFGIGLRLGLGKSVDKGILKAGLSVTAQGILEGTIAFYNAFDANAPDWVRDAKYYFIQGKLSIVGRVYGSIDFAIISAKLDITVFISVRIVMEAYEALLIFFSAGISVSLEVKINLGIFSITIDLSFKTTIEQSFKIGESDPLKPWNWQTLQTPQRKQYLTALDVDDECLEVLLPTMKWQPVIKAERQKVPLYFAPQFTAAVDGPLGVGGPRSLKCVAMTYLRSRPAAEATVAQPTPFDDLAWATFVWTLNALINEGKSGTTYEEIIDKEVTRQQLQEIYCYLSREESLEPFTYDDVVGFLSNYFDFTVTLPPSAEDAGEQVSVFPALPLLTLKTSTGVDHDFSSETPSSREYLLSIKRYFEQLAARYRNEPPDAAAQGAAPLAPAVDDPSLATYIFLDFFALLAKSTIQSAIDLMDSLEVDPGQSSLADIVRDNPNFNIGATELAFVNRLRRLNANVALRIEGATYIAKQGDSLASVAARFGCDLEELQRLNPYLDSASPEPATKIKLGSFIHTTNADRAESLLSISGAYRIPVETLAAANQDAPALFAPGEKLVVPFVEQMTAGTLAQGLQDNGSFTNLSGLSARVLLQGLRPPSPPESKYNGEPTPLYQLTGQQFDASTLKAGDTISLNLAKALPWFKLENEKGDGLSIEFTVTEEDAKVLDALLKAAFSPDQQFEQIALFRIEPRKFTLPAFINWQTPVVVSMVNAARQPQDDTLEPTMWKFSSDLQQMVTGEKAIEPMMKLLRQVQEDASHLTRPVPVNNFSWSTFFTVTLRPTPKPGATDGGTLPNVYELQGLEGGAALLLQNLLTYYGEKGTPLIDQIQLLYPLDPAVEGQQEPPVGLKSDASPTFFLLQTNLSTVSNPPQLSSEARDEVRAASQSNLVGMTDIEFIKLLWEAGIVQSGGYYLYYETEGAGLPGYLFSEDGTASLTILVTYTITDNVVRSFLNSVVVREAIDLKNEVLFLQADILQVEGATLAQGESLERFALRHQISISKLVTQYENRHAGLTPQTSLRIPPRTHRIRSGETLQEIAARHQTEEAAIASLNEGRDLERLRERSFLKLPATSHEVAPGDTLDSLSRRFGVSLIALAHANSRASDLFQEGLTFDHRLEDKISNVPPGNVGFKLKRTNPDGPAYTGDNQLAAEQKQLDQLYNLLEYRIAAQGVFKGSDPALPVGPAIEDENPSLNLKSAPVPPPHEVEQWVYEAILPVYPFVDNEEGKEPASSLVDTDNDPYAGIGETAVVEFNWQDLFGNWIDISAAGQQEMSDRVITDWPDKSFFIAYTDPLVAVDQWPSVTAGYQIENDDGPTLLVLLRFYTEKYLGNAEDADNEVAQQDLELFQRVYFQLKQPDVVASVTTTLGDVSLKEPDQPSPREMLIEFVEKICQFLTDVIHKIVPPPDPIDQTLPFNVSDSNPKNIFDLLVSVAIKRNADLVADEFKDVPAVTAVSSLTPPNLKTEVAAAKVAEAEPPPPLSLQDFAQKIQDAFPSLKVLAGVPQSSLGEQLRDIWIARFASSETGIEFTIDAANPLYYAVKPLAVTLLSEPDVLIYPYHQSTFIGDETGVPKSFSGVDMESLAVNFLAAVDRILQADYAVPLWLFENESPAEDEPIPFPFQAIIEAKKGLAGAVSDHLTNVFEGQTGDQENLRSAREALRQELLIQLSSAYTVNTVVEFDVKVEHSEFGTDCPNPPLLFGMPVAPGQLETAATTDASAYAFSTARMSLSNVEDASKLTFLFETRNKRQEDTSVDPAEPYFEIDLDYQVNAIEEPAAQEVPGIKDYRPSTWLMFVLPFNAQDLGELKIPIPLRAYPTSPSLTEQTFTPKLPQFVELFGLPLTTPIDELKEARQWNYRFTYEYVGAAQDTIHINIKINTLFETFAATARVDDEPTLFEALLQFSQAYPGIAADLDNYLAKGTDAQIALNAARSFAWLAERAARAWGNWDTDVNGYLRTKQESPEFEFQILERPEDHENEKILKVTVKAKTAGMALPLFEIPGYVSEPPLPPVDAQEVSYLFYRDVEGVKEYLSYRDAKKINRREMTFRDFDVMEIENAWAGAFVVRNEDLVPGRITNPDFKYQTPIIRFINPLTPALDPALEINIADFTPDGALSQHTLETLLNNFFAAFFEGIGGEVLDETRTVKLGGSYRYYLQPPEMRQIDLQATLPVFQTTPVPFQIDDPDNTFVTAVSEMFRGWVKEHQPVGIETDGRLFFDLSVFSSLSQTKLPVLRLRNLYLRADQVIWEPPL